MSEDKAEWREGWWNYSFWTIDWFSWGLGIDLTFKIKKEFSIWINIGPCAFYVGLEYGHQLFVNGANQHAGFGPV